jgi:hypothetical protein
MKTKEQVLLVSLFEKEGSELLSDCAEILGLEIVEFNLESMDTATELAAVTSNLVGVNCDLMTIARGLNGIARYLEDLDLQVENPADELVGFVQALEDLISDSMDAARSVVQVARELAVAHS